VGKSCPVANSPASVFRVQRPAMSTRNLTREPVLQKSCAALHFHTPTLLYTRYSRQHLEVGFTRFTIWSLTARSKKSYKRQCPRPIKKKTAKKKHAEMYLRRKECQVHFQPFSLHSST
jgi:hypothetical protein